MSGPFCFAGVASWMCCMEEKQHTNIIHTKFIFICYDIIYIYIMYIYIYIIYII